MSALDRLLRAGEGKKVRAIAALVPDINAWEPELEALSDDALRGKTAEFKGRLDKGEDLDDLLIEAFAVTREAAGGQRHTRRDGLCDARDAAGFGDPDRDAQRVGPSARGAQQERNPESRTRAHEGARCHSACATANHSSLRLGDAFRTVGR